MSKLPLAVDIAAAVTEAGLGKKPIDLKTKADQLLKAHPESEASLEEVADTLRDESKSAGVPEDEP